MININSKSKLEKFTLTELIKILYQLDWNGSWEDEEEWQEPLTKKEAINYVLNYVNEDSTITWYVNSELKLLYQNS